MKKNLVKCIAIICIIGILSGCLVNVFAEEFSDIAGHWAENTIIEWSDRGIIKGYDGCFFPDDDIIRGDMAVIINRVMNYSERSANLFFDLPNEEYYTDSVLKLNRYSIMLGDNNYIRPVDCISREEAFVMIARVYGLTVMKDELSFTDSDEISDWAMAAVSNLVFEGILEGAGNNMLYPKSNLTRAEALTILAKINGRAGLVEQAEKLKYEEIELSNDFSADDENGNVLNSADRRGKKKSDNQDENAETVQDTVVGYGDLTGALW